MNKTWGIITKMRNAENRDYFSLEEEVIGLGESIELLREKTQITGFFGLKDVSARETNGPKYGGWNIEQNTGSNQGLRLCYDFGPYDLISSSTTNMLGLNVDYRIFFPRVIGVPPLRGSMYGWHYFNKKGEIAKVTDIAIDDLRNDDVVIVRNHNKGEAAIIDDSAYDKDHAPGNIEALGLSIQSFSKPFDQIAGSIR